MLTPAEQRFLQCLLTYPTKTAAAQAAGISERSATRYLANEEFQGEYKRAFTELVTEATRQAQQALSPALSALRDIVEDTSESASSRIAAARSLLEYGVKLSELYDLTARIAALEKAAADDA